MFKIELGKEAKDKITGVAGIIGFLFPKMKKTF